MEWLSKLFEYLKLPIKSIWGILIVSAILLFAPDKYLTPIYADSIRKSCGTVLGIVFLISLILVLLNINGWLWKKIKILYQRRRFKTAIIAELCHLDLNEKAVLREFFLQDQNTIQLPIDEPVVAGLLNKRILTVVGKYGEASVAGRVFPVSIFSIIKPYISYASVGLPDETTEENMLPILKSRPGFVGEIAVHNEIMHSSWRGRERQ